MRKRTKAETERFYRGLLADQQRSGQSIRAFARGRGVPAGTLSFWSHELRKRDAARRKTRRDAERRRQKKSEAFLPVSVLDVVPSPGAAESASASCAGSYEVDLGGGRLLRLPADFDGARVAALVRAVASC